MRRVHMILQRNIAVALAERGWSQTEAADEIGLGRSAFNERMRGRRPWRVHEVVALAAILNIPVKKLMHGIEEAEEYEGVRDRGVELRQRDEGE